MAFGEVGLAGEVRPVPGMERRLVEIARLGFRQAVMPRYDGPIPDGLTLQQVDSVHDALAVALHEVARG